MKALVRTTFLAGALLASIAPIAAAQTAPPLPVSRVFDATTLNISAFGETKAAPDEAVITLGVQTTAPIAADAMRQNAERMSRVIAALRGAGVADKDIQTSNLSLNAQYDYPQNQPAKLTGYQASNDVTITVEDLARLGPTVDAITAAGANQINGISFGLKDSTAAENDARVAAVKALSAKADLYASATGYRVARLVNLSEGGDYQSQPVPMMAMARVQAAPVTPVSAGQLDIRITVSAVFELTR